MSEYWSELEGAFDELCPLPPPDRERILAGRVFRDERVRPELERLLRSHDEERAASRSAASAAGQRRFGVWQTTTLLGRGGMAEVWLAERADGQHEQRAALKILSPYLASPDSIDRFRRERQTLARLEHPNIARLLDGGVSADGEPYLVMEYVEGEPLDRYCQDHALSLPDRLRLISKVCLGVHAAHLRLIIHRDLKPSNILVNRDGEPKLLDFGIAKAIEEDAERTATTNRFFTPAYACPEILRGEPASVASDVYALGVLLYELLTGRRPFDASTLSPAKLVEAITTQDPPRPSLASPASQTAIRADLDAIVMKALAREPLHRYASASELSADLGRYLAGEPVIAVPPSGWYIARTFVRRNKPMVAAAAVVLFAIAAGVAGTLWQAHRAQQQRLNAEQRFLDARQLADYVLFGLYDSVSDIPGALPVQADMAHQGLAYLDRLASAKSDDPALRLDLARGYTRLGAILGRSPESFESLDDNAGAVSSDRKALALLEPLAVAQPSNLEIRRVVATANGQLGFSLALTGQYGEAFDRLKRSADTFEQIAAAHPDDVRSLQDAGDALRWYGLQLSEKGGYVNMNPGASRPVLEKSAGRLQAALQLDPSNARTVWLLTDTRETLARSIAMSSPRGGLQAYQEAFALLDRLPANEQSQARVTRLRAEMLTTRGFCHAQVNELEPALADLKQAVAIHDRLADADRQNAFGAYLRMSAYRSLGIVEGYAHHKPESLAALQTATSILDHLTQIDPANRNYAVLRAEMQRRVGNALLDLHRRDEARPFFEASIAYLRKAADSPVATPQQLIEAIRSTAEAGIESLRDYPAALRYAARARDLTQSKDASVLGYLAEAYGLTGRYAEAAAAARQALALVPPQAGNSPSLLQKWLQDEIKEYGAKEKRAPR